MMSWIWWGEGDGGAEGEMTGRERERERQGGMYKGGGAEPVGSLDQEFSWGRRSEVCVSSRSSEGYMACRSQTVESWRAMISRGRAKRGCSMVGNVSGWDLSVQI